MCIRDRFDVLRSCDIHASADASTRNPQANDFSKIFDAAQIHMVFANGKKAYELYQRHCLPVTRRAVSYTHLDVYKRQDLYCVFAKGLLK